MATGDPIFRSRRVLIRRIFCRLPDVVRPSQRPSRLPGQLQGELDRTTQLAALVDDLDLQIEQAARWIDGGVAVLGDHASAAHHRVAGVIDPASLIFRRTTLLRGPAQSVAMRSAKPAKCMVFTEIPAGPPFRRRSGRSGPGK